MKQIGIAAHIFLEIHESRFFPPRFSTSNGVERSWRVELLPFLDEAPSASSVYQDAATWDAAENASVTNRRRIPYNCPANERPVDSLGRVWTAYLAVAGSRSIFGTNETVRRLDQVPDGTSNTAMIVEACGQNVVWTEPRDLDADAVPVGVNLPSAELGRSEGTFSATHPGGPGVLMVDGSVQTLDPDTDPAVLRAILTVDGNERGRSTESNGLSDSSQRQASSILVPLDRIAAGRRQGALLDLADDPVVPLFDELREEAASVVMKPLSPSIRSRTETPPGPCPWPPRRACRGSGRAGRRGSSS